ncbi:TWiK family of potassium channels protein 7 [Aphelenchoides fujianensis]|nr:TWiK family of potassium channels protein 7 [Aphelenchoides fujianensis]
MDEDKRKEIQLLIENSDNEKDSKLKKYARLVLPHVALVAVVCVYAIIGAYVFYSLESPHEDRLKNDGIQTVQRNRREIIEIIWEKAEGGSTSKEEWMRRMSTSLQKFNVDLYRAYKEQYVRYGDVRMSKPDPLADPRVKRHRSSSKSRSETGGKLWTATSSLFFAVTTMATIGYGDLVPVTTHGRMACVIFALFGAPLAIITIGDLGKFLSECTIWIWKNMIEGRRRINGWWHRLRVRRAGAMNELDAESGASRPSSADNPETNWAEIDRTEVPVLLVFVILLLYIAFGGILFSFLENWSYMDAFYYCFVSLTTIGFGDLVPSMDNGQVVVLMLIYLGVGLAVTTMCIDLEFNTSKNCHYFGRKFKGTDVLLLLKRKRMLERQLLTGNTEEIMQFIQQVAQEQQKEVPPPPPRPVLNLQTANEAWQAEQMEAEGASIAAEDAESWHADETLVAEGNLEAAAVEEEPLTEEGITEILQQAMEQADSAMVEGQMHRAEYIPQPPSPISNSSARRPGHDSGPSLSRRCSVHTTPSVHERERMYDNRSHRSSVTSFKFSFDGPWPDLREIAAQAKEARRVVSCPGDLERPSSPTLYSAVQEACDFIVSAAVGSPPAAHLAARCEVEAMLLALGFRDPPLVRLLLDALVQPPDSGRQQTPAPSLELKLEKRPQTRFFQHRSCGGSGSLVWPAGQDPLDGMGWLNISPRALAVESETGGSPGGSSEASRVDGGTETPDSVQHSLLAEVPWISEDAGTDGQ